MSLQMTPRQQTVNMMKNDPSYATQLKGCSAIRVDSSDKTAQDEAAREGVIEALVGAMDLFPEDKKVVSVCTQTLSSVILFNRKNGLRAGKLGALNRTLHVYMQNMDDPSVMCLGGAIGAYFDYVDENRRIAAELGGIQAIIQNIKNHFHGKYGEWSHTPVLQSLYALSSGCWVNQDICFQEGFPKLAVELMREHGHEPKIAEETQQATKALMFKSDAYRERLADLGMTDSMVHVLQVRPHDRGAVDLTCENFAWLVGPQTITSPSYGEPPVQRGFNRTIQSKALESGALGAVVTLVTGGQEMHHVAHEGFNFDVDASYNVNKDCFFALAHLSHGNPVAQEALWKAGLGSTVLADFAKRPKDLQEFVAGCSLLNELKAAGHEVMLTAGPLSLPVCP
eukprot:CAMPEP_0204521132 /NCGR_PEP_ID=MMETSP0661-20131031/5621_1 /ASSEMBLY_ACC=CAM_ASM_000606 /TAXON_ID=109239 /ORGANISM="Alexandrium margalefi, Strain AMGDE01CS-322" /LENGTH=395 /DNA_ID=CAMNT_0051526715 /DNA_START=133 /DNA_END=1320 /DNA_ORIENTATION=+